jgi:hypothetical protein
MSVAHKYAILDARQISIQVLQSKFIIELAENPGAFPTPTPDGRAYSRMRLQAIRSGRQSTVVLLWVNFVIGIFRG